MAKMEESSDDTGSETEEINDFATLVNKEKKDQTDDGTVMVNNEEPEHQIQRLKEESRRCQLYMRTSLTIFDISTDICQAILLFQLGYIHYPILMILIDFLPGIFTLCFSLSYVNKCHPLVGLGLVAHPLLMPGICLDAFINRKNTDSSSKAYRMYMCDVAKFVIGNLQAPCQMILTSYLVMTDVLEPPWIHSTKRVDAQNHVVSFGPLLTLLSLILSAITSFKASTETVDILKLYVNGHVEVAVAWLTHFILLVMFRIMAWTLLFICAGWFSLFALTLIFGFCVAILAWKRKYGELSVFGKKNLIYLEWPIPIFGLISPAIFLPESVRPANVSTPLKLINQVLALGGNFVLMVALIICFSVVSGENHNITSLIVIQARMGLLLQVSLGLGAFSSFLTLILIGTSHKDEFIFSPSKFKLRKKIEILKQKIGERYFSYMMITTRLLIFIAALLTFILPIALSDPISKGSVTLLVAGYKGKTLTTHIDVLSYGKTCRAKGIPSLPEFRSEPMVQLIRGYHMLVMCGGQVDGTSVTSGCLATEPRKRIWKKVSPMPFRLYGAASASVNDKMYILGGIDQNKLVKKTVLEYDPYFDSWVVLAEMTNGLEGACAVSLKHGLVITGGNTGYEYLKEATYLGRTDEDDLAWVRLPAMFGSRAYHGCTFVTLEDFGAGILVAGGQSDPNTVLGTVEFMLIDPWGLTPITSSWIRLPNLNFARHSYPSVGVVNHYDKDVVLVAGGLSGSLSSTDTIEELSSNPLTGRFEWNYRNVTLLKPRHSINTVVVPAYFIKPCD